jgi:hypothetical protein
LTLMLTVEMHSASIGVACGISTTHQVAAVIVNMRPAVEIDGALSHFRDRMRATESALAAERASALTIQKHSTSS